MQGCGWLLQKNGSSRKILLVNFDEKNDKQEKEKFCTHNFDYLIQVNHVHVQMCNYDRGNLLNSEEKRKIMTKDLG